MILDTEEQRQILLHIVNGSQFPGAVVEKIAGLKSDIQFAPLEKDLVITPKKVEEVVKE